MGSKWTSPDSHGGGRDNTQVTEPQGSETGLRNRNGFVETKQNCVSSMGTSENKSHIEHTLPLGPITV